ncbi:hypothetical protein FHR20_000363 [Sphingomonas leidyi]|uniref:Uncharacterized protein n=1 Tax=Sphingomonas leidyi TaxID=68569 RepID=A0A7X5ZTU8_9SPHN|nr:hypothetical protein [Sphingomonas leidyi]
MSEAIYGPIITLLVALLFGWLLIQGFRTGTATFEQPGITLSGRRKDQPVRFWAVTALLSFLTFSMILATIWQILIPDGTGG